MDLAIEISKKSIVKTMIFEIKDPESCLVTEIKIRNHCQNVDLEKMVFRKVIQKASDAL